MTYVHALDPGASPLDYYGYELRRCREEAGLTQRQLGELVNYTASLIGQIETARKLPTVAFSERVDAALDTGGLLSRLLELVMRSQLPAWFREAAELEARANEISIFQTHMIHGLLQTPEYARAVLGALDRQNLEDRTAARLARQRLFAREAPPVVWVILGEAALCQEIGGREVMRGQLGRLLALETDPRVNVQILPFSSGVHAGMTGAFNIFRFHSDPNIVYTEGYGTGYPTADPDTVRDCELRFDHLQASALPLRESAALMRRVLADRYAPPAP
ncbi:Scr1 family TA system antitoxin-like transcriptional regulator [Streptomyces sp. NPDC091279]|uniref:helix-turn-helix domain-containing protein n=1 Tax=unclassified Streptomyces TaxID=2593676 RepID=UPI00380D966B